MNTNVAYQKYQNVQVKTANRGKLLLMLYQGCIKFLRLAEKSIEEKNIEGANNYLVRSQDIIRELQSTLDIEKGGRIARDLNSLYDFMIHMLLEANIKKEIQPVKVVEELMLELLETWKEIINGQKKQRREQEANVSV